MNYSTVALLSHFASAVLSLRECFITRLFVGQQASLATTDNTGSAKCLMLVIF